MNTISTKCYFNEKFFLKIYIIIDDKTFASRGFK